MKKTLLLGVGLVLVALVAFRLYQQWPTEAEAAGGFDPSAFARTVGTARAEIGEVSQRVTLVGSLQAEEMVDVTPKASGRIVSMAVDLGDEVRAGGLIARLEDDELRQQVQQSEASLEVSRAVVEQRELELQNQGTILARSKDLRQQGLISAEELEQAQIRYDVAQSQLNLARAQLVQSEAGLRELGIRLEQTRVTAPISGFVGRRFVDVGAFVSSNAPIVTLIQIDTVELLANVPERDVVKLSPGATGDVSVDALPTRTFAGRVARISPLLDPQTRTAQVEIVIPNPDHALRAEMFARVDLELAGRSGVLRIPRAALVVQGEDEGVYTIEEGRAVFRAIESGLAQEDWIEVRSGLQEGDVVITDGANLLNAGDRVRTADSPPQETTS